MQLKTNEGFPKNINDHYELQDTVLIGTKQGTFVYGATDNRNSQKVVVKIVIPPQEGVIEADNMRLFSNDRIIQLYDYFEIEGYNAFAIVTERMYGGDAISYLETNGALPEDVAAKAIYPIVDAYNEMHQVCVINRDIKLENIFVKDCYDDLPYFIVGDLGSAKKLAEGETLRGEEGTTPTYRAPEIFDGKPYSYPADVWSFGVMLFGLLTNSVAFNGSPEENIVSYRAGLDGSGLDIDTLESKVSTEAVELISACLAPDPSERPSFREIMDDPWFMKFFPDKDKYQFPNLQYIANDDPVFT